MRNYAREYKNYQGLPKSIKERASRNKARKIMVDKHGEKACKNKHIDHKDHNPLNNKLSNLRIRNPSTNMSDNSRKKK
jgi:hypothetical protein